MNDVNEQAVVEMEKSDAPLSGVVTTLAELPERSMLDEAAMAKVFGVVPRTIRRMVTRHELPPPIPVAGKSSWFAGRVLDHLEARAEQAAKDAEKVIAKIARISP